MKILLNIPFHTGSVPARRFFQFSMRCPPGMAVNPFFSAPLDLVALIKPEQAEEGNDDQYDIGKSTLTFHAHSFFIFGVFFIHSSHLHQSFILLKRNTIRLSTPVIMNRNTDNAPPIP